MIQAAGPELFLPSLHYCSLQVSCSSKTDFCTLIEGLFRLERRENAAVFQCIMGVFQL